MKRSDIEQISEGTLLPLESGESATLELKGRNVQKPLQILAGKTTLAKFLGEHAHVPILQMVSPKDGIVGGTSEKSAASGRS